MWRIIKQLRVDDDDGNDDDNDNDTWDDNDDYGAESGQLHTCFASCSVVNGESGCW